jgi:hypothetical protein
MTLIELSKIYEVDIEEYLLSEGINLNKLLFFKGERTPDAYKELISKILGLSNYDYPKYLMDKYDYSFKDTDSYNVSIDLKRLTILRLTRLTTAKEVDIKRIFDEFLKLDLSKSYYITKEDVTNILNFINKYGYPFIPYVNNIRNEASQIYMPLIWNRMDESKNEYPYFYLNINSETPGPFGERISSIYAIGCGLLYYLEEFRRYQLFISDFIEKYLDFFSIEDWEKEFFENSLNVCIGSHFNVEKDKGTSLINMDSKYLCTFGEIVEIMKNYLTSDALEGGLFNICHFCGKPFIIKRGQWRWSQYPCCGRKGCRNKYQYITFKHR